MNFSDKYLQIFCVAVALSMALVAMGNWLNRKHGGFLKGWGGAVFIAVCWFGAIAWIVVRLQG